MPLAALLCAALALVGTLTLAAAAQQGNFANVLLVIVDDLRPEVAPYLAASHPMFDQNPTPNLASFAANSSMTFTQAFNNYPNCNPSRQSFLTGIRPYRLGMYNKGVFRFSPAYPWTTPLPSVFSGLGYVTYGVGKIFHHEIPALFSSFTLEATQDNPLCKNSFTCIEPVNSLTDSWTASAAVSYLVSHRNSPSLKPFFLAVGFHRPHDFFSCPSWAFNDVDTTPFVSQLNNGSSPWYSNGIPASQTPNAANGIPASCLLDSSRVSNMPSPQTLLNYRQGYASNVLWVDYCIGRVLQALSDLHYANNTVVVIMADHGVHLGEHGSFGKSTAFEESARIPLMIGVPWLKHTHGAKTSAMFESIDLVPTLVDLATGKTPNPSLNVKGKMQLDGQSVAQVLRENVSSMCGNKCFALTEETRCTSLTPWNSNPGAPLIACEVFNSYPSNFAPVLVYSLRTPSYRYVEIRVSTVIYPNNPGPGNFQAPQPIWTTNGLIGRALFNHSLDDGYVTIDSSRFERQNIAPCASCSPYAQASGKGPLQTKNPIALPSLPSDVAGANYVPPELDGLSNATQLLVTQLSQVIRGIVRDRSAPCSWHGLPTPTGSASPCSCFKGWYGANCQTSSFYPPQPTAYPTTGAPTTPAGLSGNCVATSTAGICASSVSPCQLMTAANALATCQQYGATLCKGSQLTSSGVIPSCAGGKYTWTSGTCKVFSSAKTPNGQYAVLIEGSGKALRRCQPASALAGVVCCVGA